MSDLYSSLSVLEVISLPSEEPVIISVFSEAPAALSLSSDSSALSGLFLISDKQDYDAIADEIFRLRDQKEQSELDSHRREEVMNRIKELQDFIAGQETDITEFDEALVKKLIEKITVFANHFTVEFKSGITIDIEA